ncbi:polymer-forming cytoskeletal protein [Filobacillus milosensis]|uniref:Polymer-forming cytoskeletal protein n=1 Tax=Filobacillus milosensis TaxID=94137 RepID=A0A4Y8IM50_9BACI|nr:polymer-forming cytoskeletal protein [Filobacillus milosensis]TFB21088.1 polymer-forming cytoskeletal protein [Filobacillus milosensis]
MRSKQDKKLDNVDTIIGAGTVFKGDVDSEASIRVDGTVAGTVNCKGDVVIGQDGQVDAEVKGRNITVAGTIKGNVTSQETLKVESTGKLLGDAKMATLVIDEGGKFDGHSSMGSSDATNEEKQDKKEKQDKNKSNKKKDKAS